MKYSLLILCFLAGLRAYSATCEGGKAGELTTIPLIEVSSWQSFVQYEKIQMFSMVPDEKTLTMVMVNLENPSQAARTTATNYKTGPGSSLTLALPTNEGVYKLICR